MHTVFVVTENYYEDYENHGSDVIGIYSSKELAELAIEEARFHSNSPNCLSFEEYLDETGDSFGSVEDARHHYNNYQNMYTMSGDFSWSIKEFTIDKGRVL